MKDTEFCQKLLSFFAKNSKAIPLNKIERLINENELDFIFLRPSYFMQNLTTILIDDIKTKREIVFTFRKS